MNMRTEMAVSMLAPRVYREAIAELSLPEDTDMSKSNKCHVLTLNMSQLLRAREFEAQRELHIIDDGAWHYLLSHRLDGQEPSSTDYITDLTPWQYDNEEPFSGFLHGTRDHVQEILERRGAPDSVIALRGLQSLVVPNSDIILDFKAQYSS